MQIVSNQKEFEEFDSKFEPFETDSKHLNANSNHSKGIRSNIWTIPKRLEVFQRKLKQLKRD